MNIVEGKYDGDVVVVQEGMQFGFVQAVAFTRQPFDTVAVNGVVVFFL